MRNMLLRMLGALLCALVACAEVTSVADFSLEKVKKTLKVLHLQYI